MSSRHRNSASYVYGAYCDQGLMEELCVWGMSGSKHIDTCFQCWDFTLLYSKNNDCYGKYRIVYKYRLLMRGMVADYCPRGEIQRGDIDCSFIWGMVENYCTLGEIQP